MSVYTAAVAAIPGIARYHRLGEAGTAAGVAGGIIDQIAGKGGTSGNILAGAFGATGAILDEADTAITFNGTNSYIALDNSDSVFSIATGNVPFWGMAWVSPGGSAANNSVLAKVQSISPFAGWEFGFTRDTTSGDFTPYIFIIATNGSNQGYTFGTFPNMQAEVAQGYAAKSGEWSCVFWQYNPPVSGTVTLASFKMWINGTRLANVNIGGVSLSLTVTNSIANTSTPSIGGRNSGATFPFNGGIDEVAWGTGNSITDKIARDVYIAGIGALATRSKPTVILSTDCESDVDSYCGEFGTCFAAALSGLISLPNADITNALTGTKIYDAKIVSMLARYHGVNPIISQNKGSTPTSANTYSPTVAAGSFPFSIDNTNVATSITTLKTALTNAANNSLIIFTAGPLTNLAGLLNDGAATVALIYSKVQKLVCFGGGYVNQGSFADSVNALPGLTSNTEFNIANDVASADTVTRLWPTTIEYLDVSLGGRSALPGSNVFTDTLDPKNVAYTAADAAGRQDWGGVGILHIIYAESGSGPSTSGKLFTQSATGTNVVNTATNTPNSSHPAGYNRFTPGNTRNVTVSGVGTVTLSDVYVKKVRQGNHSAWAIRMLLESPLGNAATYVERGILSGSVL